MHEETAHYAKNIMLNNVRIYAVNQACESVRTKCTKKSSPFHVVVVREKGSGAGGEEE